jgi:hypothetical protein
MECLSQKEENFRAQCDGTENGAVPFAKRHFTAVLLHVTTVSESQNDQCKVLKPSQQNSFNSIAHVTITTVAKSPSPTCKLGHHFRSAALDWVSYMDESESLVGWKIQVALKEERRLVLRSLRQHQLPDEMSEQSRIGAELEI